MVQVGQFRLDSGKMSSTGGCAALEQTTEETEEVSILECIQDCVDTAVMAVIQCWQLSYFKYAASLETAKDIL